MFLFRAFETFVIKVDGGHQPGKHRVLKHHTTYHAKQQHLCNSCGFFIFINMLCFGSQPFTNVSVSPFICTLPSSFIFTHAFHLLLIHFLLYHGRTMMLNSLIRMVITSSTSERIAEFLVTQVINPKGEFHFE
jgi:hypothetical protein